MEEGATKKRFHLERMSFRNRIVLLILLIGSGAALLLTIVFGGIYYRSLQRDYRNEIRSRLQDTDTVLDSYMENVTALTISLYNTSEGTLARIEQEFDMASYSSYMNYLQTMMANFGYIHSIYFINQNGEVSMWAKGNGSYTKDLKQQLTLQLAGRTGSPFVWNAPYRYDDSVIPMLTFFFGEVPLGLEYYSGAVVVNVELEELCSRILGENNRSTQIMLLNSDGIVALHTDTAQVGQDWSEQAFVKKILTEKEAIFQMTVDGKRYEFIVMPSELEGFFLVARSDYTDSLFFAEVFLLVPILYLVIIVLMAFLSMRMGTRIVRPLTRTVEEIKRQHGGREGLLGEDDDPDELHFLQEYASQISRYVAEVKENDQKNRIVFHLLRNDRDEDIQPLLLEWGILEKDKGYCVITAEFICRYEVADIDELNSIRKSAAGRFTEVLDEFGYCMVCEHGLRYLLFILSERENVFIDEEILRSRLDEACGELMEENSETDFYAVVSHRMENGGQAIKPVVRKNNERMELLSIYEKKGAELAGEETEPVKPSEKTVVSCIYALKNDDRKSYLNAVSQMVNEMEDASYPQFVDWIVQVTEQINEVKAAMQKNSIKSDRSRLYRQVSQICDRKSLHQWFEAVYDDVSEKMDQIRKTTTTDLMEEAVDYIMTNFWDDQLGVTVLADRVHISAQYFGQLFMEFAGKSASEYIIQVRMEKARNYLLTRPDLEIMEVAQKVGYRSASYFSTAFKKYYGVSPSKFRSSVNASELKGET